MGRPAKRKGTESGRVRRPPLPSGRWQLSPLKVPEGRQVGRRSKDEGIFVGPRVLEKLDRSELHHAAGGRTVSRAGFPSLVFDLRCLIVCLHSPCQAASLSLSSSVVSS